MVELRAVQSGFPLYGTVGLQGGQTYSHALLRDHGALVRPELLTALGLARRRSDHHRTVAVHHPRGDHRPSRGAGSAGSAWGRAC